MIIIYLIITIFILLLLILNNKEYFTGVCNYIPWGPSLAFCEDNCKDVDGQKIWGSSCDCEKICNSCKNELCEWVPLLDRYQSSKSDNKVVDNDNELLPKSLKIQIEYEYEDAGVNAKGKTFKLIWSKPESKPYPFANINKYMIHILDLSNPLNKVDVFFINENEIINRSTDIIIKKDGLEETENLQNNYKHIYFNKDDSTDGSEPTKNISYTFEQNKNYSVNIYALNKYGISNPSNTLII